MKPSTHRFHSSKMSTKQDNSHFLHLITADQFERLQGLMEQEGAATVGCQLKSRRRQAAKLQLLSRVTNSFHRAHAFRRLLLCAS